MWSIRELYNGLALQVEFIQLKRAREITAKHQFKLRGVPLRIEDRTILEGNIGSACDFILNIMAIHNPKALPAFLIDYNSHFLQSCIRMNGNGDYLLFVYRKQFYHGILLHYTQAW